MDAHSALSLLGLAAAGLFAGAVNTVAGGGSFIALPALMAFGLSASDANATNRVGVLAQSTVAAARFRAKAVSGGADLVAQLAIQILGASMGAALSLLLKPSVFERALGVVMLAAVALSLLRPRRWSQPGEPSVWRWPALLAAAIYGGFAQAGVGVMLLSCLVRLGGVDAVSANARKVLLVAALSVPSVAIYAWAGLIDWPAALLLTVTSSVGGWLGVWLTVGYGPRLVWAAIVLVVFVSAWRLIV